MKIDDLPMHKDEYFFGYGIDIEKPTEMASQIIKLRKENQELKKQLEEYKHHLKNSKEMLDLQGRDGNYNYDNYMLGLYNGMAYIISLFENRSPIYKNGKDIDFLEDKNKAQQKEFIKYLTSTIEELESDDFSDERMKELLLQNIITYKEILSKYKEIVGDKDEI